MKKLLLFLVISFPLFICNLCYGQWERTGSCEGIINCLAVSGANIFVGTDDQGVFLSTNNGTSWNAVNNGILGMPNTNPVYSFDISGSNIFAGTGGGVFLSTNNGTNWNPDSSMIKMFNNCFQVWSLAISGSNIFAGTDNGVILSTNNGGSWASINNGLPDDAWVFSLAISGNNIFAGTIGDGVFISTNNGISWNTEKGLSHFTSLAVIGTNIFIGGNGVILSTNNGSSWTALNNGLPESSWFYSLAISGENIYAATEEGVFLSTNYGNSWNTVNKGFTDSTGITSLVINGAYIYAATYYTGVWRRALSEMDIVNELGMKVYPNPANAMIVVSYSLLEKSNVSLIVYDLLGNQVSSLVNKEQGKGDYKMELNVEKFTNGIYFCKVEAGSSSMTKKIVVMH